MRRFQSKSFVQIIFFSLLLILQELSLGVSLTLAQSNVALDYKPAANSTNGVMLQAPPKADGPVEILTHFDLLDINNIDDKNGNFDFVGVLTLSWKDSRLSFDPRLEGFSEKIFQGDYQINQVFPGWSPQVVLINQSDHYESSGELLRLQADGTATLTQMINADAEVHLSMRRHPFDHQHLEAVFGVLGFDKTELILQTATQPINTSENSITIDQWSLNDVNFLTRDRIFSSDKKETASSTFVVSLEVQRESFFMLRLVLIPLAFIVILSWSVFWMDRASLADRISICFVGILTSVAYQIVIGDLLPHISYVTFMNAFLNISFFMMSATVVVNLVIGSLDRNGRSEFGDLIEQRSRWIFPITYIGLLLFAWGIAVIFF